MYNVNLEVFQGPLDLLLHLIEKMEIDIYNIPIAKLTESYLEYINNVDEISLENAEEYIVMAATLIHIKSKSLLPTYDEEVDYDEEDEFVKQLLDYKNYKEISDKLELLQKERLLFLEKESISFDEDLSVKNLRLTSDKLLVAIENVLKSKKIVESTANNISYEREVSLEEVREDLTKLLVNKRRVAFSSIINEYNSRNKLILIFVSILSMVKEGEIDCTEKNNEIYIDYVKE